VPTDLRDGARHSGHGGRVHAPRAEGDVAVVLDHQRVGPALREGARVVERGPRDAGHIAVPARAPGERAQVHHADDRAGDVSGQADDRGEAHLRDDTSTGGL
jgi:hypothetical protein